MSASTITDKSIDMQKKDFIICAPLELVFLSHGAMTLVQLARAIERSGRSAFVCTYQFVNGREAILDIDFDSYQPANAAEKVFVDKVNRVRSEFGIRMLRNFTPERIDGCYVVYPEVMRFNALNAKRVVRYFLNKDTHVPNTRVEVGPDDFVLSFSDAMHPDPHHVSLYVGDDSALFNNEGTYPATERKMDITYIGKGDQYGLSGVIPGTIEITRTWPTTKEQLAILLRNCRFFYTGDACTKLNLEALSCGAIPAFIHNGPWTDAEIDGGEFGVFPRLHAGTKERDTFLETFEVQRTEYLGRLRSYIDGWDANIARFIEKVDAHFDAR